MSRFTRRTGRVRCGVPATRPSAGPRTEPPHGAAHRKLAAAALVVALGGAAVTTTVLLSRAGLDAGAAPDSVATGLDASPVAHESRSITCWDGAAATRVKECGVPTGRRGVATVFPSLDRGCLATAPVIGGKVEVFTCHGSGYVIRYTRWQPGFDRFAVFSKDNRGRGSEWVVAHEFAGRVWASRELTADGARHFRWTATYRAQPLSVEVQATSLAGRQAGMAAVVAVSPRQLGRAESPS